MTTTSPPRDFATHARTPAPMKTRNDGVRLPLQVGTSALWAAARAAATIAPGGLLLAAGVAAGGFVTSAIGLALLGFGLMQVPRAWRTRASDAVLTRESLAIEGGPLNGTRLLWETLDPDKTRAETRDEGRLSAVVLARHATWMGMSALAGDQLELAPDEAVPIRRLHLVTNDGRDLVAAEAEHPGEQASLDALLGTIADRLGDAAPEVPKLPPQVVGCPGCGAPVRPSHEADVGCDFCDSRVPVPDALRQRVASQQALSGARASIEHAVAALLEQPGATRANAVLTALGVGALVVWTPVVLMLLDTGFADAGSFEIGWGLVSGALAVLVLFVFARAALVRRRALRLLTSAFGARAPAREGTPSRCRRCAAPLPDAPGVVVQCVFCEADNVLGLDLRRQVKPTHEHALSLAQVMNARRVERRRWLVLALVVLPVAGVSVVMTLAGSIVAKELAAMRAACAQDDAGECRELAVEYDLGISVDEDDEQAFEYYLRACELGLAEACWDVARGLYYGWGVEEDPETGETYRVYACDEGFVDACGGF